MNHAQTLDSRLNIEEPQRTFCLTSAFVSGYAEYTIGLGVPNAGWQPLIGCWGPTPSAAQTATLDPFNRWPPRQPPCLQARTRPVAIFAAQAIRGTIGPRRTS